MEYKLAKNLGLGAKIDKIKINGHDINYLRIGKGDPLVLLHGVNIGWGQWYENINEFAKYFEVFALDFPGAGGSSKIDFSKMDLERDLVDVVEKFVQHFNFSKVRILGHSLGGWAALKLYLRKSVPINKIALVSPMGFTNYLPFQYRLISIPFFARLIARTVMKPTRENMKKFLLSAQTGDIDIKDDFVDYFYESVNRDFVTHPFLLINRLSEPFKIKDELVFTPDALSQIDAPVLIVSGACDSLIPIDKAQDAYKLMPNAQVHIFDEAGHVPFLEEKDAFNNLVWNFLFR